MPMLLISCASAGLSDSTLEAISDPTLGSVNVSAVAVPETAWLCADAAAARISSVTCGSDNARSTAASTVDWMLVWSPAIPTMRFVTVSTTSDSTRNCAQLSRRDLKSRTC